MQERLINLHKECSSLLIGKGTKLSDIFLTMDKSYEADMYMGKETSTLDPEGECVCECDVPAEDTIKNITKKYQGAMKQIPPKYSAIHIQGKRASDVMREGKDVEMPTRDIMIYSLGITHIALPLVRIQCRVSKGTYIRALVRDIARDAGSCAFVQYLERNGIGDWDITHTTSIDTLLSDDINIQNKGVHSLEGILDTLAFAYKIEIDNTDIRTAFKNGTQPLETLHQHSTHFGKSEIIYMLDEQGLLAVWKYVSDPNTDESTVNTSVRGSFKLLLHY